MSGDIQRVRVPGKLEFDGGRSLCAGAEYAEARYQPVSFPGMHLDFAPPYLDTVALRERIPLRKPQRALRRVTRVSRLERNPSRLSELSVRRSGAHPVMPHPEDDGQRQTDSYEMSEELIQRGLTEHGLRFGPDYEFYNIGNTTIRSLRDYRVVPNRPYSGKLTKKPDGLLVDRRKLSEIQVLCVVENKAPNEFDTPEKRRVAVEQCVNDYCKPLGARFGVITDGTETIWVNPQLPGAGYSTILREDGYPLHLPFGWTDAQQIEQTLEIVGRILEEISPANSQLVVEEVQNPAALADRVWQQIWLASGENPDACLATFVEIFVFKYLSDLGVLTVTDSGVPIAFSDTLEKDRDACLVFYSTHVRPHIKQIFPASTEDGTSVINGTVLSSEIREHNLLFHEILRHFEAFGPLRSIDPEFKSRLYEHFLKKSISQKNWGQFFTPRNIVKAMIEMSDIELLPDGAKVHDPAAGVGGFILEPLLTRRPRDYYFDGGELKCRLQYSGHDRDPKTVILAKANMLIHLNELIRKRPSAANQFAAMFNRTFRSAHASILGSLSHTPVAEYDLVVTNPPFVVTGTSAIKKYIRQNGPLRTFYTINAMGVEGLFLEKIVRSLRPGGRAVVIVPDGVLNRISDQKLREFISKECIIEAVISLPSNAFYTTPKKTYILSVTKKHDPATPQTEPVFSYVVVNTGETLDAKRFPTENNLPEMVRLYKYFRADKQAFASPTARCKVWPIESFAPHRHWSVDRWWPEAERVSLGIADERHLTTLEDFATRLGEEKRLLEEAIDRLRELEEQFPNLGEHVEVSLGDARYFETFIGKRVLKREIFLAGSTGTIPVYSANPREPMGYLSKTNIADFSRDSVLWGIDGNLEFNHIPRGTEFRTTDHCGCIRPKVDDLDGEYIYHYLNGVRAAESLDRELRANLANVRRITLRIPVLIADGVPVMDGDGLYRFDIARQRDIAAFYSTFSDVKREISERMRNLAGLEVPAIT